MSTMRRQSSFQAGAQPKFSGSRCASIACSQVWLGLAFGCLQSVSICIAAVRAQWWSFLRCELRAMQSRSRLLVTKWESGEQPVVPLTSAFDMCWVYSILKILHSAPMYQMHQDESADGRCLTPIYQHWDNICLTEAYLGFQPDAWLPDPPFQHVHAGPSYTNPMQDLPSAATRGVNHASQIDKCIYHFIMTICHLDCCAWCKRENIEFW